MVPALVGLFRAIRERNRRGPPGGRVPAPRGPRGAARLDRRRGRGLTFSRRLQGRGRVCGAREAPLACGSSARGLRPLAAPTVEQRPLSAGAGGAAAPPADLGMRELTDLPAPPDAPRDAARLVSERRRRLGRLERASPRSASRPRLGDAGGRAASSSRAPLESKRRGNGDVVSVSRNVFIPLTNLCRDRCAYCTFAKQPDSPEAKTYTLDEVAEVVRGGVAHRLHRGALLPRRQARDRLPLPPRVARRARASAAPPSTSWRPASVAFEGGMLPHTNAGILSADEMARLRRWNASMGLMLETTSPRLREKGMAHQYAPDKEPAVRLRMHEEAGELRIPFTSGLLLGIGETPAERVDTLLAIRDLSDRYGHIQECIVQPFHPKPGTRMRWASPLSLDGGRGLGRARAARARPGIERAGAAEPRARRPRAAPARRGERLGRRLAGDRRLHQPRGAVADARRAAAAHRGGRRAARRAAARLSASTWRTPSSSSRRCARRRCGGRVRTATRSRRASLEAA